MKTSKPKDIVPDGIDESRREFISKLVVGTAFATPLIASFSMDGALIGEAQAGVSYYAPYCGDRNVSFNFTARFKAEDNSFRFNVNLIADVLDGSTYSVVVNASPRNNFKTGELFISGKEIVSLQLGPNVIPADVICDKIGCLDPCNILEALSSGGGFIFVATYDNPDGYIASLDGHG